MFDALSDRLQAALGNLTGRGRITEDDVNAAMREVRLALLEADVNYKVVKDFVRRVKERAVGAEVIENINAGQMIVKIVHEELTAILGEGDRTFRYDGSPAVVMLVGLQGSGKTTSAAKLARWIVRQGRQPMLVAADIYRPAAIDQLKTLGASLDIPVHSGPSGTAVVDIATEAVAQARQTGRDVVILDTAGRLQIDEGLMAEIRDVHAAVGPRETLLVVDAMVGQEAVAVAEAFHENTPVSGLVLTKIDGDARGGAALSIAAVSGLAVKFMGTGERPDEFEVFHPDRLAGRILGMGDVVSLVERAQEAYDEKEAAKLAQKLEKDAFTLEDFLDQMQQVKKMGPLGNVISMIPGLGGAAKQAQDAIDRGELGRVEAIIRSMTPAERADPGILNASRRRRIAKGSGTSLPEVNRLVKQFAEMQKVMKMMRGRGGRMPGLPMGPLG
ncbi:MAG: signal recognition particle protein [Candidatus Limnocylindrales bacterium]